RRPAPPSLSVPAFVPPPPPDAAAASAIAGLFDEVRGLSTDGAHRAALDCAAARMHARAGDSAAARRLYERALDDDPGCVPALRGLRRLSLAEGDARSAIATIDRELSCASEDERAPLALL